MLGADLQVGPEYLHIVGPGTIVGGDANENVIKVFNQRDNLIKLSDFTLQMSANSKLGIYILNSERVKIERVTIVNASLIDENDGIRINGRSSRCRVNACTISRPWVRGSGKFAVSRGVHVTALGLNPDGTLAGTRYSPRDIEITNNRISGGTHGVALFGAIDVAVSDNQIAGQSQRGIIASPRCENVVIKDNEIRSVIGTGVHIAYASQEITVKHNEIKTDTAIGEGGLQTYLDCSDVAFVDNLIRGPFRQGIYVGPGTQSIDIEDNLIVGAQSAIVVEDSWRETRARYRAMRLARSNDLQYGPVRNLRIGRNFQESGKPTTVDIVASDTLHLQLQLRRTRNSRAALRYRQL